MRNSRQRDALIAENKILLQKVRCGEDRINHLEESHRTAAEFHFDSGLASVDSVATGTAFGEDEEESMDSLRKCVQATEELLGMSVLHYSRTELPPNERLLAGRWYEITMHVVIMGSLKAAFSIVEGLQGDEHKVLSAEVAAGENVPARAELASLLEHFSGLAGPVQQLYSALGDYATKSAERVFILKNIRKQYSQYLNIKTVEEGIVCVWPRLFQLFWSVQWNEDFERIINSINIELSSQDGVNFIAMCESSVKRLTEPSTSSEARLASLREISAKAVLWCKQH